MLIITQACPESVIYVYFGVKVKDNASRQSLAQTPNDFEKTTNYQKAGCSGRIV